MATRTLQINVVGDSSKGRAALKELDGAIDKTSANLSAKSKKAAEDFQKFTAAPAAGTGSALQKTATQGLNQLIGGSSPLAGNILSQFGGAEGALAGISTGAAVATAGLAVAGIAVTKFGVDSVRAFSSSAAAVDKFQDVAGGTAEEASVLVGAAQQLGVSTDALGTSMGRLLKGANANEKAFQSYGATVVRTKDGSVDAVGTLESVAQAFAKTTDPAKRAELASLAFGRGWQQIVDVLERGGPVLDKFLQSASEHAPMFSKEDLQNAVDFKQATVELGQEWTKFKVNLGEQIVPPLTDFVKDLTGLGDWIGKVNTKWNTFADDVTKKKPDDSSWVEGLKNVNQLIEQIFAGTDPNAWKTEIHAARGELSHVGEAARNSAAGLDEWGNAVDSSGDAATGVTYKYLAMGQALYAGAAAATSAASAWQAATADMRSIHDVTENYNLSLSNLDDLNAKVQGSSSSAGTAVDHSARQIGDAQKSVQDAIGGVAQAEADYARTSADVQQALVDAETSAAKSIVDAQQNVVDVEESAAKSIVDAQQKVIDARQRAADQALSSSRSVADAEQAVRDAAVSSLTDSDQFAAQRKSEEAVLHLQRAQEDAGTSARDSAQNVASAQSDLADTEVKAARDRADAQSRLADTETQAAKDRARAQQDAADKMTAAQKQIQGANDRVSQANESLQRTTDDAAAAQEKAASSAVASIPSHQELGKALQGVTDNAAAQAYQMKLAGASDADISAFLATTATTVQNYGSQWGFTAAEIAYYNDQVKLVQRKINIQYNLSLNLDQYTTAIKNAAASVGTTSAQFLADAGQLGIEPTLADTGGWLPNGLSLMLNKTGSPERILGPGEGTGGAGVTINNPIFLDGRGMANYLADLKRQGYL